MLRRFVQVTVFTLPILFLLLVCGICFLLFQETYHEFVQHILQNIGRTDLEAMVTQRFFTIEKYRTLKLVFLLLAFVFAFATSILYWKRTHYLHFWNAQAELLQTYINKLKASYNSFSNNSKYVLWTLLLLILCRSIFYATTFYIQYDEAWNYNYFLHKNIVYILGAYNNYPLHNLVTWCFVRVFGNATFVLRMPSILMGLLTCFYSALYVKALCKSEVLALLCMLLFACMPVSLFYMMYSRGVMFELFFTLVVISFLIYCMQHGFSLRRIIALAFLNALATFSMLSHPYFILGSAFALFLYGCFYNKKLIQWSFVYALLSLGFSILFLLPFMLGTGLSLGLDVTHRETSFSILNYIIQIQEYASFITGFEHGFYVLLVINLGILFSSKKRNAYYVKFVLINMCLVALMIIIPFLSGIFPPQRAMSFLVVVSFLSSIMLIDVVKNYISKCILIPITCTMAVVLNYQAHHHHFLNWSRDLDKLVYTTSQLLLKNGVQKVYNENEDFGYFNPGLEYYYHVKNQSFQFYTNDKHSARYTEYNDTLADCVVTDSRVHRVFPAHVKRIFVLGTMEIYILPKQ